jgi:hypothetical protein
VVWSNQRKSCSSRRRYRAYRAGQVLIESILFWILNPTFKFIIYVLSEKYRIAAFFAIISITLISIFYCEKYLDDKKSD